MGRYNIIFVMVISLCLLALFGSKDIHAQPFGITAPQPQQKTQQKLLSSANGRFVFGQISGSSKDQFMLDTFTGRLWRIAESGAVGLFLRTVPYRTKAGEHTPVPEPLLDSGSQEGEKQ